MIPVYSSFLLSRRSWRAGRALKKGQYLSYLVNEFCCRKSSFRNRAVSSVILSASASESWGVRQRN